MGRTLNVVLFCIGIVVGMGIGVGLGAGYCADVALQIIERMNFTTELEDRIKAVLLQYGL